MPDHASREHGAQTPVTTATGTSPRQPISARIRQEPRSGPSLDREDPGIDGIGGLHRDIHCATHWSQNSGARGRPSRRILQFAGWRNAPGHSYRMATATMASGGYFSSRSVASGSLRPGAGASDPRSQTPRGLPGIPPPPAGTRVNCFGDELGAGVMVISPPSAGRSGPVPRGSFHARRVGRCHTPGRGCRRGGSRRGLGLVCGVVAGCRAAGSQHRRPPFRRDPQSPSFPEHRVLSSPWILSQDKPEPPAAGFLEATVGHEAAPRDPCALLVGARTMPTWTRRTGGNILSLMQMGRPPRQNHTSHGTRYRALLKEHQGQITSCTRST